MKEEFKSIINGNVPVLVDFHATWCGLCKTQAPILKDVAADADIKGKARIIKIDVDKNQTLAQKHQVQSVPTLLLFKKGQSV
ncbi:MAG: thioredoxin family protein [Bacteroidales bacterium]|nr:thioredoxin family protein [Bacteroidales bacterium]